MSMQWTPEQYRAIELHNSNILVSAAAGSGKTAVLVERIIRRITDESEPLDVERLVVVTFTNAAAAEMRDRIRSALEGMLEAAPDNRRLQRQLAMLHLAQITTIDSFCLNILRNNYMSLNLDPGFRVADPGELELIKADVMEELLEDCYREKDHDFLEFAGAYSGKKSDVEIEELINSTYEFARSYPWPEEWLDRCAQEGGAGSVGEFDNLMPVKYLYDYIMKYLGSVRNDFERLLEICGRETGPFMYIDNINDDLNNIDIMMSCRTFSEWSEAASRTVFTDLSRRRGEGVDAQLKETVKTVRTRYRDTFRKLRDKLCAYDIETLTGLYGGSAAPVRTLVTLVKRYMNNIAEAKREKNIIDFGDMEQLTKELLVRREDGKTVYTPLADELAGYYEEILVDEYQDSNLLQEQILAAITRERIEGAHNNLFMVGDVKQSIYKFRLARPDLFLQKYADYPYREGCERIELRRNFRSRREVLNSVNAVFESIMHRECGGIDYTEEVRLNPGSEFAEFAGNNASGAAAGNITSIRLVDMSKVRDDGDAGDNTVRGCEGREIAAIIKELVDDKTGMYIADASCAGGFRRASYGDIAVLTRSVDGWADEFAGELMNCGIPAVSQSSSGYYNMYEIEQILNVLAIIDNPRQDIPLAAVMTSYFGTLTIEELAVIRGCRRTGGIYDAVTDYVRAHDKEAVKAKLDSFLEWLSECRREAEYLSIHELIWKLVYDTGFYDYVGGMPSGQMRQTNLDMLCNKARSYERTSYHGLFNFLRYIDKVKKYDIDNAARGADTGDLDVVRIMSIHKSKGLEFPIVIVAGMAKEFNNISARGSVIVDADIGIGADIIDTVRRTRVVTPLKTAVELKITEDNLAEEIRILYVAMTRAREKLIMTGTVKNYERSCQKWLASGTFSFSDIIACHTYLDFVMPVALKDNDNYEIRVDAACEGVCADTAADGNAAQKEISGADAPLYSIPAYPYEYAVGMRTKMSVSEIKHFEYQEEQQDEFLRAEPLFADSEEGLDPAGRGTAYHRVMECFDYSYSDSADRVREYIDIMLAKGLITQQQMEAVNAEDIYAFCQSSLGIRIKAAFAKGKLCREKPFVMGVPAGRIKCCSEPVNAEAVPPEKLDSETVLIQGVIDLFFEENRKIVLVDYKTDRVGEPDGKDILKKRYSVQLEYYAEALEKAYGMEVSERLIYSFTLNKTIPV